MYPAVPSSVQPEPPNTFAFGLFKGEKLKHLKPLGLAVMAVLAPTALFGASPASATEFHATGGTTLSGVVGENNHVFTIEGSSVTCNNVAFSGTAAASGTSGTLSLHPSYSNCTAFGIIGAVINTHNCVFSISVNNSTAALTNCYNKNTLEINIPAEQHNNNDNGVINIVALSGFGNCRAEVKDHESDTGTWTNQAIFGQTFTNMGTTGSNTATLTWNSSANNIVATVTESNGICPINTGTKNTVEYDGNTGIMGATGGTSF
jgi:hypothetical protein